MADYCRNVKIAFWKIWGNKGGYGDERSNHETIKVDPKVAFPRKAQPKMVTRTKKIFVGGLSAATTVDDVKNFFGQFGKIEDAMLMFDKTTNRHRGLIDWSVILRNDKTLNIKVVF
ncbi:hypothetical protein KUTeg_009704 [Tegillarca granosa]|uniref:RRM domain-containing protein n=1 Tax=Tegillarca granosa TaxID=220873 RepID=A0ABQ9F6Y3_TEGGR|nr:hypothetical protein KUTeg_009704 [Tegillarca granosa]